MVSPASFSAVPLLFGHGELGATGTELLQRREMVIAVGDIRVEDGAVFLGHLKRGVSQELLQGERIPSAVQQVLAGKGVAEHVEGGLPHPALVIVSLDGQAQSAFREHFPMLIAK